MFSKAITTALATLAAATALALTPQQMAKLRKMQERPAIVGRDTMSVPGAIIEHWDPPYINDMGEAEYYRTNLITRIVGEKQPTTWSQTVDALLQTNAYLFVAFTNQVCETATYSNLCVVAQGMASAAQAKINDEIADLQAKIVKYEEYQKKYPIVKSIFAALITDAQNRIKVLQALTTNN